MDVVVDLTDGTTLRKNGLKIIGQIMESHTVIIANKASWNDPEKRREIEEIGRCFSVSSMPGTRCS